MKSQPVNSFHEKVHSSSLDDSFELREFSAILKKFKINESRRKKLYEMKSSQILTYVDKKKPNKQIIVDFHSPAFCFVLVYSHKQEFENLLEKSLRKKKKKLQTSATINN